MALLVLKEVNLKVSKISMSSSSSPSYVSSTAPSFDWDWLAEEFERAAAGLRSISCDSDSMSFARIIVFLRLMFVFISYGASLSPGVGMKGFWSSSSSLDSVNFWFASRCLWSISWSTSLYLFPPPLVRSLPNFVLRRARSVHVTRIWFSASVGASCLCKFGMLSLRNPSGIGISSSSLLSLPSWKESSSGSWTWIGTGDLLEDKFDFWNESMDYYTG